MTDNDVPITSSILFTAAGAADNAVSKLLTEEEHLLVRKLGSLMGDFREIAGEARSRHNDLTEVCNHVHALQNMVLAQAAGRAFPKEYRLMGETLG